MSKKTQRVLAIAGGIAGTAMLCCILFITLVLSSPSSAVEVTNTPYIIIVTATSPPQSKSTSTITPTDTPSPVLTPATTLTPSATLPAVGACVPTTTQRDVAMVVDIVDGDTIDVVINGQLFRVRYIGIDTPENGDPFYYESSEANQELVHAKEVLLVRDVSETDRYGRLLRYAFVGNVFVNQRLVEQGVALASTYPPDVACSISFASAQNQAQAAAVGLWESTSTAEPTTAGSGGDCDPSYPTVCIAPPPPDLDCGQISHRRFTVLSPDPHGFDGDHDGIGCEGG